MAFQDFQLLSYFMSQRNGNIKMKISELISKLQSIQDEHGDHLHVTVEPVTINIFMDEYFKPEYYNTDNTSITNVEVIDDIGCTFLEIDGDYKALIPMKHVLLSFE